MTLPLQPPYTALFPLVSENPGQVAQLVEHLTENQGVGGSIPSLATTKIKQLRAARKLPVSVLCAYIVPTPR